MSIIKKIEYFGKGLCLGLRNEFFRFLKIFFGLIGVFWTIIEVTCHFGGDEFERNLKSVSILWIAMIIIIIVSVIWNRYILSSKIKIGESNNDVSIVFDDLFIQEGVIGIAVNNYFDSSVGKIVSENSLHGLFLQKFFKNHKDQFDDIISRRLISCNGECIKRSEGKNIRYPIGTCVSVEPNHQSYFIFSLSKTNPETHEATCDLPQLLTALDGFWEFCRKSANGNTINIPLIGDGLSRVGLEEMDLLNIIISSYKRTNKMQPIGANLRIVLHESKFEKIDLKKITNFLK